MTAGTELRPGARTLALEMRGPSEKLARLACLRRTRRLSTLKCRIRVSQRQAFVSRKRGNAARIRIVGAKGIRVFARSTGACRVRAVSGYRTGVVRP